MFTRKLKALNSDDSDEDEANRLSSAPSVTREALEQRALLQYQEALHFENTGLYSESEKILQSLLESQILSDVNRGSADNSQKSSFLHLKYCITLNLGHCLVKQDKLEEGLDYYLKASYIEDSDLNLWYKIGSVSMKVPDLKLAATAFAQGLKLSPNHWGCLDSIVSVLYALGDSLNCLYYIKKGICLDSAFIKGHVLKKAILSQSPYLQTDFAVFYPEMGELKEECLELIDEDVSAAILSEADNLAIMERKCWNPKLTYTTDIAPCMLPSCLTWLQLANTIFRTHQKNYGEDPKKIIFQQVLFDTSTPMDVETTEPVNNSSHSEASHESIKQEEDNVDQCKGDTYQKWLSSQKRRSARVRSTVRREEPSLARSLAHLIPAHLLQRTQTSAFEDSMETMDLYRLLFESKELDETKQYRKNNVSPEERKKIISEQCYFGTYKEVEDIRSFMQNATVKKYTLVDCIKDCIEKLSEVWKFLWPNNLTKTYMQLFKLFMKYNSPNICRGNDKRTFKEDLSILMYGELLLDKWLEKGKEKGKPSPLHKTLLGGEFPSLYLGALDHRACISTDSDMLARVFWLQGMLFYYLDEVDSTTNALETMLYEPWFHELEVKLPNIQHHYIINSSFVSDILKSLSINKSLSNIKDLYQDECYEDVIAVLSDSLRADQLVANCVSDFVLTRFQQFSIMIDSLWKLAKYKECFYWSECFLFDCLTEYKNSTNEEDRSSTAKYISTLLDGIVTLMDTVGNIVYGTLPNERKNRFVQTLSSIICLQMDVPESTTEMTIESIAPWLLLYHVIKYDEEAKEKYNILNSIRVNNYEDILSASLTILHQGHDYLGRRGWCCFNEGSLLFFSLDVMYPLLEKLTPESKAMALVSQEIDQIFYCLYGQQKKSKGRHLVDHKTLGLALTWNRARQVFRFTKPKELPSYDSTGKCSINSETESMYLKLIACVPEHCDPSCHVSDMTKYMEGESEDIPQNIPLLPEDITNIYYLLAHFYFRNKYWSKALKYYLLDVCANPSRVDSWACLALARGSLIDTKINSCDIIKNENDILKSADMVSRCYDRSLRLDPLQSTLWIEKGSFCYTIHSFCSNILKKEANLSLEMFDVLENKKESMLSAAMDCFSKANKIWYSCKGVDIQDERWLHHYMMGKICEKKGDDPQVYIDHYLKAAQLLHEMGALYPSCLSYASPQRLAVESLEIYYRIHASILKFLEKIEGKTIPKEPFLVYRQAVKKMAESPFVLLCQITKEEIPKTEISNPKEVKNVDSDEPYSPGENTADILSNSNSQNDITSVNLLKSFEINTVQSEIKPKDSCETQRMSVAGSEGAIPDISAIKEEMIEAVVQPALSSVEGMLKEGKLEPIDSKIKSPSKESDRIKRTVSIESDGLTTSDSVSKASAPDKTNKTSDSSSENSSSSDSDSSSDSSSSDSSSSSSDQESESNPEPEKAKPLTEVPVNWDEEYDLLIKKCLQAMENCSKRFQEHFKSLYHLALFYFKSKKYKDLDKVKCLLLDSGGLFAERKSSNFFNGIWRIPNNEIDRPGNFAAHMGRCTQLLLEFLKETRDYKMLIDLALFLKLVPDADKKYLRDTEREELCREALSLAAISMRKKLTELSGEVLLKPFLIDVFCIYKKVSKSSLKEPMFTQILSESFFKLTGLKSENNLDSDVQQYFKKDHQASERTSIVQNFAPIEHIPPNNITPIPLSSPILLPSSLTPNTPLTNIQPPPQTAPLDLQTKTISTPEPKPPTAPIIKPLSVPVTKPLTAPVTKSLNSPTNKPLAAPITKSITSVTKCVSATITKSTNPSLVKPTSAASNRGRSTGTKRPRGRPPGTVSQPLRHSINAILHQRPDMFLPMDPFKMQPRNILSITPVGPASQRPRKPRSSHVKSQQPSFPASISITSVTPQTKPFSYQPVSIIPRAKAISAEPKLPPATIIPLPLQTPQQSQVKARHPPPPPSTSPSVGPSPPKVSRLDLNVAQVIKNLGSTITITPSTGEAIRSKSSSGSQLPTSPLTITPGSQVTTSSVPKTSPLPPLSLSKSGSQIPSTSMTKSPSSQHIPISLSKSLSSSQLSPTSLSKSLSSTLLHNPLTKTLSGPKLTSVTVHRSIPNAHLLSTTINKTSLGSQVQPKPLSHLLSTTLNKTSPSSQLPPNPLPKPPPANPSTSQQKDPNIKLILLDD